jgi:hypothetical protein
MHKRSNNLVPLLGEPVFYCNIQPQHLLAVRGRNGILSKNALQVENWDVSDVVDWLGGLLFICIC